MSRITEGKQRQLFTEKYGQLRPFAFQRLINDISHISKIYQIIA